MLYRIRKTKTLLIDFPVFSCFMMPVVFGKAFWALAACNLRWSKRSLKRINVELFFFLSFWNWVSKEKFTLIFADALAACNYLPQSREKIIAALFKALNSTNNELQEAGEACMRKVSALKQCCFQVSWSLCFMSRLQIFLGKLGRCISLS